MRSSEWVFVASHQMSTFSVISWREQVLFWWDDDDDDDVRVVLNQYTELDVYTETAVR
jgi:hypothetical protein